MFRIAFTCDANGLANRHVAWPTAFPHTLFFSNRQLAACMLFQVACLSLGGPAAMALWRSFDDATAAQEHEAGNRSHGQ